MSLVRTRVPRGVAGAPGSNGAAGTPASYVCLRDQKTAGTAGDGVTSGAWRTLTLQTEQADAAGVCSLSSNQFTLTAGTYIVHAVTTGRASQNHKSRIRNVTDSTTLVVGTSEFCRDGAGGGNDETLGYLAGKFTVAASKALEVQLRITTTFADSPAMNFGEVEVYTIVELWKVA